MSSALQAGALACAALGVLCGGLALLRARAVVPAVAVLLELLLAAGLLRLADDPGWPELGTAAAVVGLRAVLSAGLRRG